MIYYNFKNYEEFKELFGMVEHGNGVKSRKNKILLSLYKDMFWFRQHIRAKEYTSLQNQIYECRMRMVRIDVNDNKERKNYQRWQGIHYRLSQRSNLTSDFDNYDLVSYTELPALRVLLMRLLSSSLFKNGGCEHTLFLNGKRYRSDKYETDYMRGLCEDGRMAYIRYRNVEKDKIFGMKAGKMFNHIMECDEFIGKLPEQIKRWLSEEFVAEWVEYARHEIGEHNYELHVDDNFEDIYDSNRCAGYDEDSDSFGSCMVNDGQWTFYRDAVDAKAAYLTDEDGMIVARCIIFTDVKDEDGKVWRLAERQYSKLREPALQRQLVNALIRGGHIDGYKVVGASCSDARKFVDNAGNSLSNKRFRIRCELRNGDTLSFQDSFKWYDNDIADNYENGGCDLATTSYEFEYDDHENDRWSAYNDEYIDEDCACYVETRDDFFHEYQVRYANYYDGNGRWHSEDCFEDDCIEIGGEYYYAGYNAADPEEYGLCRCPYCDEWFVCDSGCYSELTEEDYCCGSCLESAEDAWHVRNGETYCDWDEEWHKDVITAWEWNNTLGRFFKTTICKDDFNDLCEDGEATEFCGRYYIDTVLYDGEPAHAGMAVAA